MIDGLFAHPSERTVVELDDGHWLICTVLTGEIYDDRFALAVRSNAEGHVMHGEVVRIIKFTPEHVRERRERIAKCAAEGHVLGEWGRGLFGKMSKRCRCLEKHEDREMTADEKAALAKEGTLASVARSTP